MRSFRSATWLILLMWVSIFVIVYILFSAGMGPNVARATMESAARGEVVITKSRDGHYYVDGSINSTPATFLVDTGAAVVTVGRDFAAPARLSGGDATQLNTAGGVVAAEMLSGMTVVAGGIRIEGLRVAVSSSMQGKQALLGQNFLRHLTITQGNDQMVMRISHNP